MCPQNHKTEKANQRRVHWTVGIRWDVADPAAEREQADHAKAKAGRSVLIAMQLAR